MLRSRKALEGLTPYPISPTPRAGQICLDMNENPRGPSPLVLKAIKGLKKEDLFSYPDYQKLYFALANYTGQKTENLILTCGGDEAIRIILDAFVEEGENVIVSTPTYSMYNLLLRLRGARIKEIHYEKNLIFPGKKLLEQNKSNPGAVVLVNPASPTGEEIQEKTIEEVLRVFSNIPVLLDETYHHYSGNSAVNLVKKYPNLFILRTFSKAFSLAGLRLGYVISQKENIKKLHLVNPPYPVSGPAVIAGIAALEDQEFLEKETKMAEEEKKFLLQGLSALDLEVRLTKTNFILVNFGENALKIKDRLKEKNIRVRSLEDHKPLQQFLRVSLGTRENHIAFLQALKEILAPQVILFDLDGVLVNVNQSYLQAIRETVAFFSQEIPPLEEIIKHKQRGGFNNDWDLTSFLLKNRGLEIQKKEGIDKFQEYYLGENFSGLIKKEKPLVKKGFLEKVSSKFKIGLVTGRPRKEAIYALENMGIKNFFQSIVTMDDLPPSKGKPDPLGINMAMEELGGKRGVYIGDNPDDMKAAKAAGLVPIGCLPPDFTGEDRNALEKAGAKIILEKINELEDILKCAVEM